MDGARRRVEALAEIAALVLLDELLEWVFGLREGARGGERGRADAEAAKEKAAIYVPVSGLSCVPKHAARDLPRHTARLNVSAAPQAMPVTRQVASIAIRETSRSRAG